MPKGSQQNLKPPEEQADRTKKVNLQEEKGNDPPDFPVVAIGASAGGLDAFSRFFDHLPAKTGFTFVLVQHLDPNRPSSMVELLKKNTSIPIQEARNKMKLEADNIYMIPPHWNMTIANRRLLLHEQSGHPGIYHNIDMFFKSLTKDQKVNAVGIILSGTGTDGTEGAKEIKAKGGIVIVQDPTDADYDGMPKSAIAAHVADFVLPVEKIAELLGDKIRSYSEKSDYKKKVTSKDSNLINQILLYVKTKTKHDFLDYKQSTINHRMERRMGLNKINDLNDYFEFLKNYDEELNALIKDFFINVTSFFRDAKAFASLKEMIKKKINDNDNKEIRVWIPGCSTGEEAYSVCIIIEECLEELKKPKILKIFGTDLDKSAIEMARAGIYSSTIKNDVSKERLKKFFNKKDGSYQIKKSLRDKLVFAVQNIISDPPFTRMDIISARNFLIYFDAYLQKKIIPMFHYSLNSNGILFLGTAETIGELHELFSVLDPKWKIYKANKISSKKMTYAFPKDKFWKPVHSDEVELSENPLDNIEEFSQNNILLKALPPALILDEKYRLIFAHGETDNYLRYPQGKPELDIFEIIKPEIRPSLSSAINKAVTLRKQVLKEGLKLIKGQEAEVVRIKVVPLISQKDNRVGKIIITFPDIPEKEQSSKEYPKGQEASVDELEQELKITQETLKGTIEKLEIANEELRLAKEGTQPTNKELTSANEELTSANEELETSREELQSLNEELSAINSEYQKKAENFDALNDDMNNLLQNSGIATIFLDFALKIERFTPAITSLFNIREVDIGRPLSDITHHLKNTNMIDEARKVLDTLIPIEKNIQALNGSWWSMRIHPYRTSENSIAGVGITLIDITEKEVMHSALKYVISLFDKPIVILNTNFKIINANIAFYRFFKVEPDETKGKSLYDVSNQKWDILELRKLMDKVFSTSMPIENFKVKNNYPEIGYRELTLNARRLFDEKKTYMIFLTIDEII